MIVIITLNFLFKLMLHTSLQNLKRHTFFDYNGINFSARLSLLKQYKIFSLENKFYYGIRSKLTVFLNFL